MMLVKICRGGISPAIGNLLKTPISPKSTFMKIQPSRLFANEGRSSYTRTARKNPSIMERLMQPATDTPFLTGKAVIAAGSVVGLGCLCYYGLGLSSQTGAIDEMFFWPQYVRDRVKATYAYFGGSVILTAASVALCSRSPAIINLVTRTGWLSIVGTLAAVMGTAAVARSIPYKEGLGAKQFAWMLHTGVLGAMITPMCIIGGPLIMRAVLYTAGVVGGLSTVAMCAPSDKFLNMAGPLAIGLGVVFVSSLGSLFLPPNTLIGANLYSMAVYGGLVVFSLLLLYDTQKIINQAKLHPKYHDASVRPYDPINGAMSIYLDTLNIFINIFMSLSGGNRRRQ